MRENRCKVAVQKSLKIDPDNYPSVSAVCSRMVR
jgi:hypothetical protein